VAIDADDLEALAAEFVLGTLDVNERRAAEARIAADPEFRAKVAAWERRLQPLADAETAVPVPPGIFPAIEQRLGGEVGAGEGGGNVIVLRRRLRNWRIGAGVATAAAAALLAVVVADWSRPLQTEYVAVLTPDGGKPAFVLTVDTAKNTLSIRRVADAAPPDKSYELWAVEPGQKPKSLGVIDQVSYSRALPYQPQDLVFAISLEPKGGSPTGVATGPIVFSGPLVQQ
jgi:anti-sigma-K factor RskA